MPSAVAKKMITFSLVSIPVNVFAATERHRINLHLVHEADGGRIRQKRVCETDGREVELGEIARGYELPTGETLVLTERDLADLPMPDSREIRVLGFLPREKVDPVHYDRQYWLGARDAMAARPYALLRAALEESGQVAIARTALRTRDSLVAIGVRGDALLMSTLLWPDEVRDPGDIAPARMDLSPAEVALARQLMDAVSEGWRIEDEEDEYTHALKAVVEAKAAGLEPPHAPEAKVLPPAGGVSDLIAVLEAAVAKAEEEHPKAAGKRPARKTAAKKTAPKREGRSGARRAR